MKKQLLNLTNNKISEIEISDNVFGIKTYPDIIHQYIRYQNAKARQGSHKTKTRSEVRGRSKKPFSQKGTGNARQGSSKAPHFRGGAVSMGPQNRDHSFSLNKKEKLLALKSALSSKLLEDKIVFLESLEIKNHKTKDLNKKLEKFDFNSALFIHSDEQQILNFKRASSNIPRLSMLSYKGLNVRDIITYDKIFIEKQSVEHIIKRLS
tara:strand:- start:1790 stop:2413 length:624 start_codon:yes stop_codon:yes gene_type:complete